jgi:hypothetical protein
MGSDKKKTGTVKQELKKTGKAAEKVVKEGWGGLWQFGKQIKNIEAAKKRSTKGN